MVNGITSAFRGAIGLALLVGLAAPAPLWAKKPKSTDTNAPTVIGPSGRAVPGEELFQPGPLRKIELRLSKEAMDQLRREDRRYARAVFTDGETVLQDVGVHNKGAAGSRRSVDDYPALTVHFDKFVPGQRWHGLAKIHLNNSVQDGSRLCENICGELFRQAGVPAARTVNAEVKFHGRELGVYVLKEGFDKVFLKQYYHSAKGNLYDAGFLRDIDQPMEKLSGDNSKDQKEIQALAAAAREPDLAKRWNRLEQLLDMDRFISFCALEVMTYDWDGYVLKPNNYKLYWDPEKNKITFFPHGMDQMFWEPQFPVRPAANGMVARAVLETPEGRHRYLTRMTELTTNVFLVPTITNRIHAYAAPVRAAFARQSANAARDYDWQVQRLLELVQARASYLKQQLIFAPAKSLPFQNGVAHLKDAWQTEYEPAVARRLPGQGQNGKDALQLIAGARTVSSWRTRLVLPPGRYRFEAAAKTAGVVPTNDELSMAVGLGAGIRISGARQQRPNKLTGDAPWQKLAYEFDVDPGTDEIALVCELRASEGQAWFDTDSMQMTKLR